MNTHRVRVVPREGNREARDFFTYHMKRDGYMYCDERLHQWHLHQPNTGISFGLTQKMTQCGRSYIKWIAFVFHGGIVAYMVTIIREGNV